MTIHNFINDTIICGGHNFIKMSLYICWRTTFPLLKKLDKVCITLNTP